VLPPGEITGMIPAASAMYFESFMVSAEVVSRNVTKLARAEHVTQQRTVSQM